MSKFRETADFGLNFASAWNNCNLDRLGVEYVRKTYSASPLSFASGWNDFNLDLLGVEYVKKTYSALPDVVSKFSLKEQNGALRKRKLLNGRANDKAMNASSMVRMRYQTVI